MREKTPGRNDVVLWRCLDHIIASPTLIKLCLLLACATTGFAVHELFGVRPMTRLGAIKQLRTGPVIVSVLFPDRGGKGILYMK